MAQIIHDISSPNDGLGDKLRTAFDHQNDMNAELYTNKVDKVLGKDLSTNDYDNAAVSKLAGIEAGAEVNVQSDWLQSDNTADDYIKNKPDQLFASVGYFDHNDLATQTTPLTYTSGVELQLTNDTLGSFTTLFQAPYGITDIWDSTTNTFDLSALDKGDTIDLRVDLNVSTLSVNSTVKVFLRVAEGTANEYDIFVGSEYYKSSATFENVKMDLSYYIGNDDVRVTPAKLIFISDDTKGSVKVNGWYNRIIRKSVNIIDFDDSLLVKKSFSQPLYYSYTGSNVIIPLPPTGNEKFYFVNDLLTSLSGFNLSLITGNPSAENPYNGKEIIVLNGTANPITINDNAVADIPYLIKDAVDLVVPSGEHVRFMYEDGVMKELFRSWSSGGGGATTFTDLTDTPSTYTGQAGKVPTVNSAEDALEFSSFIPLTGTEVGSPVTGDIEIEAGYLETKIFKEHTAEDWYGSLGFSDSLLYFVSRNISNTIYSQLGINKEGLSVDNSSLSKGIYSTSYYGANYDDNTYVQKKYVDDAIAASLNQETIFASRTALPEDKGKLIKIRGNATYTIDQSTLPTGWNVIVRSFTGVTCTFVASAGTIFDAPNGLILNPLKMCSIIKDSDDNKILINGETSLT